MESMSDLELQILVDQAPGLKHIPGILMGNKRYYKKVFEFLSKRNIDLSKAEANGKARHLDLAAKGARLATEISKAKARARIQLQVPLIFCKNSILSGPAMRAMIHRWNSEFEWLPYKCYDCGNPGMHNGKKLVLQVDHRNGIQNDHRLENLGFICPNCHSQTETYTGGNMKKVREKRSRMVAEVGLEPTTSGL